MVTFFGPLTRRVKYSVKVDGRHYSYAYYREHYQHEIAEDCCKHCVYCDSHELEMGGREAMQLDHFRPHTRPGFEYLKDDPTNFHHACARCNLLKSDWWESTVAGSPHDGLIGFIDPFADIRNKYFEVAIDGELIPKQHPAQYMIELLALNRPHLKRLRERRIYRAKLERLIAEERPRLEAAASGTGILSEGQAIRIALELIDLYDLCSEGV